MFLSQAAFVLVSLETKCKPRSHSGGAVGTNAESCNNCPWFLWVGGSTLQFPSASSQEKWLPLMIVLPIHCISWNVRTSIPRSLGEECESPSSFISRIRELQSPLPQLSRKFPFFSSIWNPNSFRRTGDLSC